MVSSEDGCSEMDPTRAIDLEIQDSDPELQKVSASIFHADEFNGFESDSDNDSLDEIGIVILGFKDSHNMKIVTKMRSGEKYIPDIFPANLKQPTSSPSAAAAMLRQLDRTAISAGRASPVKGLGVSPELRDQGSPRRPPSKRFMMSAVFANSGQAPSVDANSPRSRAVLEVRADKVEAQYTFCAAEVMAVFTFVHCTQTHSTVTTALAFFRVHAIVGGTLEITSEVYNCR